MKTIWKTMATMLLSVVLTFGSGCTKDPSNEGNNNGNGNGSGGGNNGGGSGGGTTEGMYVGIIGFNDELNTKSISLLNSSTEQSFVSFIESLSMRDNTALYYADNTALDWLQNATLPSDLFNVSLLTFTDGLDNASLMLNSNYNTQAEFLDAINNRIFNDKVQGKSINAYAIGLKGNNVTDEAGFRQTLRKLASGNANLYIDDDMDLVIQRFKDIASQLYNEITTVNANVRVPGGYDNNTIIRITFDNVNNAASSARYIQASFSRENGKGKLSNITYYGLQSTSGTSIISTNQEGASFWYTFSELKTPGTNGQPINNLNNTQLWIYNSSTWDWRPEDEFTPSSYSNVTVTQKSAVAVLVLDCTTSLGSNDFRKMKNAAIEFIRTLNDNGGGNGNNNGGNGGGGNNGGGSNGGNNDSLVASDFEWFRQGSAYGTGLSEYGLEWRMNAKDVCAQIYPMDGVRLFTFDSRAWDATTIETEKDYLFQNAPSHYELSVYNNVSVLNDETYDDVIGTIMPNGTCYLIHITKCEIGEMTSQGYPVTISGQAK